MITGPAGANIGRYYLSVVTGLVGAFTVWIGLVLLAAGTPTAETRGAYDVIKVKTEIARQVATPKIVLIGGSGVLYGISARTISQETSMPSLNFGLHAGLGIEYILYETRQVLSSGDIALLSLEYEQYSDSGAISDKLMSYVLSRDVSYLRSLDLGGQLRFLLSAEPKDLWNGLASRLSPSKEVGLSFEAAYLVENGDTTRNTNASRTSRDLDAVAKAKPSAVLLKGIPEDTRSWRELEEFTDWCRDREILVLATYPNTVFFPEYEQKPAQLALGSISQFYGSIGVPILGTPREFMYDADLFFDSSYHLVDQAAIARTRRLVGYLRPYLVGSRESLARQ